MASIENGPTKELSPLPCSLKQSNYFVAKLRRLQRKIKLLAKRVIFIYSGEGINISILFIQILINFCGPRLDSKPGKRKTTNYEATALPLCYLATCCVPSKLILLQLYLQCTLIIILSRLTLCKNDDKF